MKALRIIISLSVTVLAVAAAVIAAIKFKEEIIAFFTELGSKAHDAFGKKGVYVKIDNEYDDFADV